MNWKRSLALLALLVTIFPAAAKGQFSRVIITGDALDQPITVTDPFPLAFLSHGILENVRAGGTAQPPADAAEIGYDLERQSEQSDGTIQTFDRVRYHPNVDPSARGYVYMAGTEIGRSNFDGKWLPATAEGDATMRALIAGEPVTCPVTPTDDASGQTLYGSDTIRLMPLKIDDLAEGATEVSPNVAGTILLDDSVSGGLWIEISWLQDASRIPIRFADAAEWEDNLELEQIESSSGVETTYEWEAILAEPGCYSVYTSAGSSWLTVYVEVTKDD